MNKLLFFYILPSYEYVRNYSNLLKYLNSRLTLFVHKPLGSLHHKTKNTVCLPTTEMGDH